MDVARRIGARLAATCPDYDDPELEALLSRYIDFKTNLKKVSQLVLSAGLPNQQPEQARRWIKQNTLVTFQTMILALHFNAPRRVWVVLQTIPRKLFGMLYMRTADLYLQMLLSLTQEPPAQPPLTDLSDPKTLHILAEDETFEELYENYRVLLDVIIEQRDAETELDAAWRPTTAHLEQVMNEYALRINEARGDEPLEEPASTFSLSWLLWFIPVGAIVAFAAYRILQHIQD